MYKLSVIILIYDESIIYRFVKDIGLSVKDIGLFVMIVFFEVSILNYW